MAAAVSGGLHLLLATLGTTPAAMPPPSRPAPAPPVRITPIDLPREVGEAAPGAPEAPRDRPAPVRGPDAPTADGTNPFVLNPEPPSPWRPDGNFTTLPGMAPATFPGGGDAFEPTLLDRLPSAKTRLPPVYPFEERRQGRAGEVLVDCVVDAQGSVVGARALRATSPGFAAAAVQAVAHWRFVPGRKQGRAVATHLQVPVVFTINPDDRI